MLRIAVPNKGTLSESATAMLREAGYKLRTNSKTLVSRDDANGIEFFYLRPRDIAVYIGEGILDLGITGRDLLLESEAAALETLPLGFGRSRFHYASRVGTFTDVTQLEGKRIATSYPVLVQRDLAARGIDARTVGLDGAVDPVVDPSSARRGGSAWLTGVEHEGFGPCCPDRSPDGARVFSRCG